MYKFFRHLLFTLDPEKIHYLVQETGNYLGQSELLKKVVKYLYDFQDERLQTKLWDIDFQNPVGLAAGYVKNVEKGFIDLLSCLGFSHLEIGSITAKPREGNPKPRIFRLPEDETIINRVGLKNYGAYKNYNLFNGEEFDVPIGINIAGETIEGFCYSFEKLYDFGDYITLNISCPNVKEGKTFEDEYALYNLLSKLKEIERSFQSKNPVLIKISSDISEEYLYRILEVSKMFDIDGFVIGNTSTRRDGLKTSPKRISEIGRGGLSGKPIKGVTTKLIGLAYDYLKNPLIVGVGGISSAEDAYEKIKAGASLLQIYTGFIYEGPSVIKEINKGLLRLLERDGFSSVRGAIGSDNYTDS